MDEQIKLVRSGKDYFTLLEELILSAADTIHLLVYTLITDTTGQRIIDALLVAKKKGVSIHLLVDAFGSKDLAKETTDELEQHGIVFRRFSPYLTGNLYSAGRRMHMKAVVIDGEQILMGGINISDNYNDGAKQAWLDYAVLLKDSEMAKQLMQFYLHLFHKRLTQRVYKSYQIENPWSKILVNDWLFQNPSISQELINLIKSSEEEILLMISYFLPGRRFLRQLSLASKRGVKVTLINSAQWDIPFMRRAIHYLYPKLQRSQVSIFEWKPSVLHAKVMLIDRKVCSIGSYNINGLSRYNSLEMNAFIKDQNFVSEIHGEVSDLVGDDSKTNKIDHYSPGWSSNLLNWFSYQIVRISLSIMFLLAKEEKNKRLHQVK